MLQITCFASFADARVMRLTQPFHGLLDLLRTLVGVMQGRAVRFQQTMDSMLTVMPEARYSFRNASRAKCELTARPVPPPPFPNSLGGKSAFSAIWRQAGPSGI